MTHLPPELSAWLSEVLGGEVPTTARPMRHSGLASAYLVSRSVGEPLVLRWFGGWPQFDEGDPVEVLIEREAIALGALARSEVPVPRLIARKEGDDPALLLQWIPGKTRMEQPDVGSLRTVLARIHATAPADLANWRYRGYHEGEQRYRPIWWGEASTWERACAATESPRPTGSAVLIHRDFHAGNLLWEARRLTGVIDWGQACVGPAEFDTAHWRLNHVLLHGEDAIPPEMAGDPAWDIEAAFGIFDWWDQANVDRWRGPWNHVNAPTARRRLEAFVGRAVAELG